MSDQHRERADDLLRQAAQTSNMKERGRLIDEAMRSRNFDFDERPDPAAEEPDLA